jgi:TolB-like protein
MICSTSSFSKAVIACGLLAILVLPSCALLNRRAEPPLEFQSLGRDSYGTIVSRSTRVRWTAVTTGGTGERSYEFRTLRGSTEILEQKGPTPIWEWNPRRSDSGWTGGIAVLPPSSLRDLIAVLPVDNLTGRQAPMRAVSQLLHTKLNERGFRLLDDEILKAFMKRYRVRHTGGVKSHVFRAVKEETGAEALLMTSLEVFHETDPPRVALFSRLVSSGERPEIAWMDGVGLSGDGSPGLLALGRIYDPQVLLDRAADCLVDSLERTFSQTGEGVPAASRNEINECDFRGEVTASSPEESGRRRHRPQSVFRSPTIDSKKRYSVAVIPFLNLSERRNAGKILAFHFVDHMSQQDFLEVIEPGLVIEQLLKYRIVMEAGPSMANAEILSSPRSLGADLVLSGAVFDYQDSVGIPKVDFTVKVFEKTSREVVWSSRSHNDGSEGVFFFGLGRVRTAHRLASEMVGRTFEVWND